MYKRQNHGAPSVAILAVALEVIVEVLERSVEPIPASHRSILEKTRFRRRVHTFSPTTLQLLVDYLAAKNGYWGSNYDAEQSQRNVENLLEMPSNARNYLATHCVIDD